MAKLDAARAVGVARVVAAGVIRAVGERAPAWVAEGFAEYQKRLSHWLPLELHEVAPGIRGKGRDAARATADEGARGEKDEIVRPGAEDDVLGHGERPHQHEVLVHHADARRERLVRVAQPDLAAVDKDRAGVGRLQPVHDVHQGGLARAVLAEQPRSEERHVGKECRSRWSPYH